MKNKNVRQSALEAIAAYDAMRLAGLRNDGSFERAEYVASNLRGTLKNSQASDRIIASLTDDLNWLVSKIPLKA